MIKEQIHMKRVKYLQLQYLLSHKVVLFKLQLEVRNLYNFTLNYKIQLSVARVCKSINHFVYIQHYVPVGMKKTKATHTSFSHSDSHPILLSM